jgi:predicted ATPase
MQMSQMHYLPLAPGFFAILVGFFFIVLILRSVRYAYESLGVSSSAAIFLAEINRVAGEIAMMLPQLNPVEAEAYFEQAVTVARRQQAKSWELRAAMSMARLWRDQGKREEARNLLAPVYGWLTEGFDTRDLKEAKALLEELAA